MMVIICAVCRCWLSGDPDDTNVEAGICGPECLEAWDKEQFGEDEAESEYSTAELEALAELVDGMLISSASDHFRVLRKHGLIEETDVPEDAKSGAVWYAISAKGRAVLAEEESR